jgi:hypothetical protein
MKLSFRKLFSTSNILLGVSITMFCFGIAILFSKPGELRELVPYQGRVKEKYYFQYRPFSSDKRYKRGVTLVLESGRHFSSTSHAEVVDNLVKSGDKVIIYWEEELVYHDLKAKRSKISSPKGGRAPEILHLDLEGSTTPIIDYELDQKDKSLQGWPMMVFSLIVYGWYRYVKSGIKSPFVIQRWG